MSEITLKAVTPEVIARAKGGDTNVIGALYRRYRVDVFRYLFYRVGDQHAAEDLTSEVFERMIRALERYQMSNVAFEAWLFQIARNLAIDHHRKMKVRKHLPLDENLVSEADDVGEEVEFGLTSDLLVKALSELSDVQRDVLILRFVNGMRIAQVAQMLHKSENAIKANQRRALIALRDILTDWEVRDVKDG
ncbi:MAG: sigma-70 family RNA polymerase sigma factor [Anaerolineales bacterium]